jgi:hypothetical protein
MGIDRPLMAMYRRYWLSPGTESGAHNGASIVGPGPGPEEGAALGQSGRTFPGPGTSKDDPKPPKVLKQSRISTAKEMLTFPARLRAGAWAISYPN